ncbi:hypothetical protein WISP_41000 [Willisornis vidua]|uniref:Uncharacterized protein n=1 Tax=Willisornis vidua TaxID=1566151 RepID=A0ABQ9DJS6_9PASS|nr:hypothetical protein WISP_41000 [Willisornis vidua]
MEQEEVLQALELGHAEASCSPAASGDPQWSRDPPTAHEGPTLEQVDSQKKALTLWKAHAEAGSFWDLKTHREKSPH